VTHLISDVQMLNPLKKPKIISMAEKSRETTEIILGEILISKPQRSSIPSKPQRSSILVQNRREINKIIKL